MSKGNGIGNLLNIINEIAKIKNKHADRLICAIFNCIIPFAAFYIIKFAFNLFDLGTTAGIIGGFFILLFGLAFGVYTLESLIFNIAVFISAIVNLCKKQGIAINIICIVLSLAYDVIMVFMTLTVLNSIGA